MADTTITRSGEFWDEISFRLYGDEHHVHELMAANRHLRNIYRFSYGVTINVPQVRQTPTKSVLPPWRRG